MPWVLARYHQGSRWLFPATSRRHIGDRALRHIVQTMAERVFPDQPLVREGIDARGFRGLLVRRAVRRRLSIAALQSLTGLGRHALVNACLAEPMPFEQLRREFDRLIDRRGRWL
jgi:hypothetical protein